MSEPWDSLFESGWGSRWPPEYIVRWIMRRFGDVLDRRTIYIRDMGCGIGGILWFLAREGFNTGGCDGSPIAVKAARQMLIQDGLHAHVNHADLDALPWADGSADAVIDNLAMTHNSPEVCSAIIAEVHRVLRPGGRFFSAVFRVGTTAQTVLEKQPVQIFDFITLYDLFHDSPFRISAMFVKMAAGKVSTQQRLPMSCCPCIAQRH